jgi:predicted nucleic acid-binding OB-fold protein
MVKSLTPMFSNPTSKWKKLTSQKKKERNVMKSEIVDLYEKLFFRFFNELLSQITIKLGMFAIWTKQQSIITLLNT